MNRVIVDLTDGFNHHNVLLKACTIFQPLRLVAELLQVATMPNPVIEEAQKKWAERPNNNKAVGGAKKCHETLKVWESRGPAGIIKTAPIRMALDITSPSPRAAASSSYLLACPRRSAIMLINFYLSPSLGQVALQRLETKFHTGSNSAIGIKDEKRE